MLQGQRMIDKSKNKNKRPREAAQTLVNYLRGSLRTSRRYAKLTRNLVYQKEILVENILDLWKVLGVRRRQSNEHIQNKVESSGNPRR